jgi:DNA-binding FrmR family transcriptional regulator
MMLCVTLSAHDPPRWEWGRRFACMRLPQRPAAARSKTARGCTSGIASIAVPDPRCPDVTKQLSAVQVLLKWTSPAMLRRHVERGDPGRAEPRKSSRSWRS